MLINQLESNYWFISLDKLLKEKQPTKKELTRIKQLEKESMKLRDELKFFIEIIKKLEN